MNIDLKMKMPTSWRVWIGLWIYGLLVGAGKFGTADEAMMIELGFGLAFTSTLVLLMIFRRQAVLGYTIFM
ncbi:MAG: hypothetical protein VB957_09630 [Pseudomonadales bacterium]